MKQLLPANESAMKICGIQKLRGENYRMSRYCMMVSCEEGTLLYHTLTGELILLPSGEQMEENREVLISNWYMVPEGFDEHGYTDSVRKIGAMLRPAKRDRTHFTILTTTDCNARCFYCYEMNNRRIAMTPKTAKEVAEYIIRVSGGKKVKLSWFGGEPLYNRQAIQIICDVLRENGITYKSRMVSNGYYLDDETARIARDEWKLERVQITIDGTEEVYNRIKAYIDSDKNPYNRVMKNIESALDVGIAVDVRLNMDAKNERNLNELIDELVARFGNKEQFDVYVALLQTFAGSIHAFKDEKEAIEAYMSLEAKLKACGLLREKELPRKMKLHNCMADDDESEVILPDGRVCKCEHYIESETIGDIYDEKRDRDLMQAWKERLSVSECDTCVLYPMCTKLKKCEWNRNGCREANRLIEIELLKRQILATYQKTKVR